MLNRKIRNLAVTTVTVVSATVLTALSVTSASAVTMAAGIPGHATADRQHDSSARVVAPLTWTSAQSDAATSGDPDALCDLISLECVAPAPHAGPFVISPSVTTYFDFFNEYKTPNGNAWWEIQETADGGQCLNWGGPSNNYVFADSCQKDDPNELWFNHDANSEGIIINLAGNEDYDQQSYLSYNQHGTLDVQEGGSAAYWEETETPP
jgi:hypothetical protein